MTSLVLLLILFLIFLTTLNSSSDQDYIRTSKSSLKKKISTRYAEKEKVDTLSESTNNNQADYYKNGNEEMKEYNNSRTATGGFIQQILIFCTILAFLGNALFLIYVFWLSR